MINSRDVPTVDPPEMVLRYRIVVKTSPNNFSRQITVSLLKNEI